MEKLDFKKIDRAFYTGKVGRFDLIDIPQMRFLMVDGAGDPNAAPAYARALGALYGLAYGIKFHCKKELERDHAVPPLEGLWWADDMQTFVTRNKAAWKWTMCLRQPDYVDAPMLAHVLADVIRKTARKKDAATGEAELGAVRLEDRPEGLVIQTLHLGSYDDEGPVLAQMHNHEIPDAGLEMHGLHHEIYLNDPRRVDADKLKTILRQPVRRVGGEP